MFFVINANIRKNGDIDDQNTFKHTVCRLNIDFNERVKKYF